ncbi:Oidioi.mRNA.OKI2018_I69.XSR.g13701.t1.cds [Oikopleura dioica]|uniref:Oidioi.mRNA.OKI2018_I69.XSR.g13701.t1.cds n=1 Tax=Oikopleura dioica TaxID=34765 RepID=A0ABN7SCS1_OIKDI|nr:Oidioi.mRNA.OKI2018_I69.XSR.g13701.t1.cds [Oikopleura dioica]
MCCDKLTCLDCYRSKVESIKLPPNYDSIFGSENVYRYPCCENEVPNHILHESQRVTNCDYVGEKDIKWFFRYRFLAGIMETLKPVFPLETQPYIESLVYQCVDCKVVVDYVDRQNHWEKECNRKFRINPFQKDEKCIFCSKWSDFMEEEYKTMCCDKLTCLDCYRFQVESIQVPHTNEGPFKQENVYRYPCCEKIVPNETLIEYLRSDDKWKFELKRNYLGGIMDILKPIYPIERQLYKQSFMYHCLGDDCKAIVNYMDRQNHWEEECNRKFSCPGCSDVVRRSDKHICAELLKIQMQEKKHALEEQIKDYKKLVHKENYNRGLRNFFQRLHY